MKCALTGQNTRVLAKAVNSFSRIGNELYLEATQNGLILRTVNDSQTAFAVMTFETGFFTDFKIDRSNTDEFCNKCKVSMKSCLSVFKNMRQVEKCQITLNLKTSKILFQFNCLFDTIKTHNVSILDHESLNAVYMTENPPNSMTAPNKMFTEIISNFRMYDNEITIAADADLVVLKNNIDMETDKHLMRTKLTLKSQEFDEYRISQPTSITFCLKELRAILNFADALALDMTINFETTGRPVVFAFGSQDVFTANFVMSTLPPDDLPETNRSINATETKVRKNRKNCSESDSKNLTLRLSDVIDLDAVVDVPIPVTVATTIPSQSNSTAHTEHNICGSSQPLFPILATTVTPQRKTAGPPSILHDRQRSSNSPNRQSTNANAVRETGTESSEGTCITIRPESDTMKENADEEMEVIPLSPQPVRRRRFKVFPRIYEATQYPTGDLVHENTDDEFCC